MTEITAIHPSTLIKLSDCKLQYYWSRNYKPAKKKDHFVLGLAIHKALELYYGEDADPVEVFLEYWAENTLTIEGFTSLRDLGVAMLENYITKYHDQDKENFEVVATEMEIARKIPVPEDEEGEPGDFYIAAIVDAIVYETRLEQYFVLEHKTFSRFYATQLSRDHQFPIERFVAEGWLKEPIAGVIYNGLRKKEEPTATTRLFERHTLYVNDQQVDTVLHRAYWQLKQLHSDQFRIYPEPATLKCSMCDFKQPCNAYMQGEDYKFLLNNLFEEREGDDYEWETED